MSRQVAMEEVRCQMPRHVAAWMTMVHLAPTRSSSDRSNNSQYCRRLPVSPGRGPSAHRGKRQDRQDHHLAALSGPVHKRRNRHGATSSDLLILDVDPNGPDLSYHAPRRPKARLGVQMETEPMARIPQYGYMGGAFGLCGLMMAFTAPTLLPDPVTAVDTWMRSRAIIDGEQAVGIDPSTNFPAAVHSF